MCVVIDLNVMPMVFNSENTRHGDFAPVRQWIEGGNGFLVFGGTKYKSELAKTIRYLRLVRLLHDGGQAVSIRDVAVDEIEKRVCEKTNGTKCNDQHIIALLAAARCPLLCSSDLRSFEFVKDRNLYPKGTPRIKIYTSPRNARLLTKTDPRSLMNVESCIAILH